MCGMQAKDGTIFLKLIAVGSGLVISFGFPGARTSSEAPSHDVVSMSKLSNLVAASMILTVASFVLSFLRRVKGLSPV